MIGIVTKSSNSDNQIYPQILSIKNIGLKRS